MRTLTLIGTLTLALLVSGCATKPITVREVETVEVVRYETVPVPEALLGPCTVTLRELDTNADLERALAEAILELKLCTQDKDQIRGLQ